MKDQYFGDVNDYLKYGLLRALQSQGDLKLLVAWMLTPNDARSDGWSRCRSYFSGATWAPLLVHIVLATYRTTPPRLATGTANTDNRGRLVVRSASSRSSGMRFTSRMGRG